MASAGVEYKFPSLDRSVATDKYVPTAVKMTESEQNAFYEALKDIANREITKYNELHKKDKKFNPRKLVTSLTPTAINDVFKGNISSDIKIFKVLFQNPDSRFTIESDLLYASTTTHNLAYSHNALYSLFNQQGGVSGYKTKQGNVVYWGDILDKKWEASKLRKEGGIRYQSNSDSQMYTLLDQVQMFIDLTAKGYYLQSYSKVLSYLKLLGLSKGKINASLIPKVVVYRDADGNVDWARTQENAGLDENGNPIYDDIEGINHEEAFMLIKDADYSKSVGGVCIGYSDNHIRTLLDDSRIQLIIGFHDKTNNPDKRYRGARYAKNYNGINEAVDSEGKTVHIGFNQYVRQAEGMFTKVGESFEGTTTHNGKTYDANDIPRLAADLYLEMCAKKGYAPAYNIEGIVDHKNYYKLLADFSLYDSKGNYAPHQKVEYNMPDQVPYLDENGHKRYMSTERYIRNELQKELKARDDIAEKLADKSDAGLIPRFIKAVNGEQVADTGKMVEDDTQYAYTPDATDNMYQQEYEQAVDDVLNNVYSSDIVVMGRTPNVLEDIGLPQLPLLITPAHVYSIAKTAAEAKSEGRFRKNTNYHGFGDVAVKEIRQQLNDPIAVLAHQEFTQDQQDKHMLNHRIVVLVDLSVNGKQVICPIEVSAEMKIGNEMYDSNIVVTYFDKSDINSLIKEAVAKENVGETGFYYINTKKANTLLQGSGYQLPQHLASRMSASDVIIRHVSENVNTKIENILQSQQFIRWFGDWMNDPANASKIVNPDGTPRKMYHGTNAIIRIFDAAKISDVTNRYIPAFYFTAEQRVAEKLARYRSKTSGGDPNVLEVYLDVKNPLVLTAREYQRIGFDAKWRSEILQRLKDNKHDGVIVHPETERVPGVFEDSYNYELDESVYANAEKYGITDEDYAWWLQHAVSNTDFTAMQVAIFNSNQAKSTSNRGTYDGNSDNIYYSYTPDKEATVDELVSQFEDGRITRDELIEALANKKQKTDPISLANTKPEDFNTTPPAKRKTGENNVDGERDTIIARGASKLFSEEFKEEAKADAFIMRYKTIKNKDALRKAAADLDENGEDGVRRWFMKPVANGVSLNDVVKGYILLERYKEIGDIEGQVAVAQKLSEMGTMGGQVVQSFTILSRFTPEGMLVYAQRVLNDVRQRMIETQSEAWLNKHAESLKLTDADIEYIYNRTILASQMPDGRDKKIMLAEIASRLQSKIPPAKGQSIKALQRISMLLNPKTIIRNVLGNTTIAPVHWLSDWIGMPLDAILAIKTGRRTKGIKTNVAEDAKASWSGFKYAIEDWLKDINTQEDLDRFEIDKKGGKSIYESGKLAPAARMLNAMDRLTSFTLAAGDRPFYEYWFSRSLNSQMAANKTTTPTSEMIEIATAEALERTWQDRNAVTEMVSKMKGAVNTLSIAGYGLGDVFIKFTKTPANIAKAIYDFSPVGFATVVRDSIRFNKAVKSGKGVAIAQRNLVKSFGNAVAGTLMYVLAVALYKSGRLVGKSDDDKDVAAFEKWVQGIPSYSIKLFGKWFSYEWMQPIGSVAAIVSDYMEAKEFEGDDKFQPIVAALKSGGEVFYNQSFLKSFQTLFTADNIVDGFFEAILDDPSSFVPQILSQFANAGDDVRRTTFDKTSPIKSAINAIKNKIPGLRNTLTEDVDVFGRVVPNSQNNIFDAFFNPANTYTNTSDAVTNHVYDLYKTLGNKGMIPAKAPYSIEINGKKYAFSSEARARYQTVLGTVSYKIIEGLLGNEIYNSYSPAEQEVVIKNVYAYANAVARANFNAKMSYELLKNYNAFLTRSKYDAMTEDEKREAYRNGVLKEYTDILDTDENGVVAYFVNKGTKTAIQNALYANNVDAAILALERGKENVGKYSDNEDDVKSYTSNMRAGVTTAMKEEYILAYYEGDEQKMAEIKQMLTDIGLYENVNKTLKEWRESVTK